jgi:hypothetical protein
MDLGGGSDSVNRASAKESLRLLNAKKKLPPLIEYGVERSSTAEGGAKRPTSRGRSAPDPMSLSVPLGPTDRQAPASPVDMVGQSGSEELVLSAIEVARKKRGVPITKPFSGRERALFERYVSVLILCYVIYLSPLRLKTILFLIRIPFPSCYFSSNTAHSHSL